MKTPAVPTHTIPLILIVLVLTIGARFEAAQEVTEPVDGRLAQTQLSAAREAPASLQAPAALDVLKTSIKAMQLQDSLLAGYCYQKTIVVQSLGDDLSTKKTEERLVEVTSIPHGPDLEVLVAVDGKRVSEKERQKSEAEQRQRSKRGDSQLKMRSEDLVAQFDWSFAGTEKVNGRPATVLAFRPKPGAVYDGNDPKAEKFMRKVSGRVWVDDAEFAIARMEFKSLGSVKSLGGLFWTVNSFFVREERKRLPEGVWIDSSGEYFIDAKALLVKRIVRRQVTHTHNYRKCSEPEPVPGQG